MYTSISGIYRNGHVDLIEPTQDIEDDTHVIVTFLNNEQIDLRDHDIDEKLASELLSRMAPFAEDWNSPEMDIYDNYDAAKPGS